MDAFPAFYPLAGRTVAIAGEGEAAEAKARLFEGSPAAIRRLSGAEALDPRAYQGAALAFVASEDEAFARAAAEAARAAHVPVNVADRPALCDFTTPAVIDRGEVVLAVGTGGGAPMLATLLRQDIEARAPEGLGRLAALFRAMQAEVRAALPEPSRRRDFLRAALTGPAAEAAMAGQAEVARQLLRAALAEAPAAGGAVLYLDGNVPAELLTLKASRALAAADVLAPDPGAAPDILALARRDARRAAPDPVALVELAAAGLRVVRVLCGPVPEAERQALAAAGVATDVLPTGA